MEEMTPERVRFIVVGMIIFILSVAVHEFGHALVADKLGDRLPRSQGRVTLNPLAHADPIGTIALPFFFLAFTGNFGFAWGKPVMHTTHDRKKRLFIAAAGPLMNVVLAVVAAGVGVALVRFEVLTQLQALQAIVPIVALNFILFFFNLLPAAPLDGSSVVRGLIPDSWVEAWDRYAVYAPFVLLAILIIPRVGTIVWTPANHATLWLFALFGMPLVP